ncbi:hypothetical protein FOCC_FOCC014947 [Frankliniella occidentalis]|nr:hypothetical protein FOCC_FOCC014947 [Frankliniella occidentalis]
MVHSTRALVDHVFTRFGCPAELHSDQGSTFEAKVFKAVLDIMGVRKTRATPLHPQSDGAVERLIRSVVQQVSILAKDQHGTWDLQVPLVMLSLRVAPHTTTGVSPAMMMFGRDINVPATMARGSVPQQEAPRLPGSEYPTWL